MGPGSLGKNHEKDTNSEIQSRVDLECHHVVIFWITTALQLEVDQPPDKRLQKKNNVNE
jgi:hypothetical protein